MFPGGSLKLGKIKGIEVNVNITWLIVFALLIYSLRTEYFAKDVDHLGSVTTWLMSIIGALILFASVLAHELSHSLIALRQGLPIRKITLFLFGGVAQMGAEPATPGAELRMAIAGPIASFAIAALAGLLRFGFLSGHADSAAALVARYVMFANVVLGCFNMLPGFPLDGGRVLRAVIWKWSGNYFRATQIAARIGRMIGLCFVFIGVMMSVAFDAPGFLWLAFIGTFLERLAFMSEGAVRRLYETYLHRQWIVGEGLITSDSHFTNDEGR